MLPAIRRIVLPSIVKLTTCVVLYNYNVEGSSLSHDDGSIDRSQSAVPPLGARGIAQVSLGEGVPAGPRSRIIVMATH